MATTRKAGQKKAVKKKAAPGKKKGTPVKRTSPKSDLQQRIESVLKHPDTKGKNMVMKGMSFAKDDPATQGMRCLKYQNQKVVTTDPTTGQQIVTIQPVCVQWG